VKERMPYQELEDDEFRPRRFADVPVHVRENARLRQRAWRAKRKMHGMKMVQVWVPKEGDADLRIHEYARRLRMAYLKEPFDTEE